MKAFAIVSSLTISLGLRSFSISSMIISPAFLTRSNLEGSVASIVPFPGSAKPKTSMRQFIELAVNIPEQDPQVGHPLSSRSLSSCSVISPLLYLPTPSNTETKSIFSPFSFKPAFIGPPETKIVGIFILIAAINIPGTILSQLEIQINPSKRCDSATVSTLSAINSLLANEYLIPICPIAIPSSTPIVLNSKGTPPASLTASFAVAPNFCK